MLAWRISISTILIPLVFGVFYLDHQYVAEQHVLLGFTAPYLMVFCLILAVRCVWELVALLNTRSFEPNFTLTVLGTVCVIVAGWWDLSLASIAFACAVNVLLLKAAIAFHHPGKTIETLAAEILVVAYVGVLLIVTAQLRWVAGAQAGYLALGSLVVATKSGDIGAYTLGRLLGRKKMAPLLSPGKTWVGGFGALAGSALGALAWLQLTTPLFNASWKPCAWYWSVVFGVVIGVVGLIGDLCESLIKRDVGKKDAAELLPGFGGLLDVLDSILYAGPVALLLWWGLPLSTW